MVFKAQPLQGDVPAARPGQYIVFIFLVSRCEQVLPGASNSQSVSTLTGKQTARALPVSTLCKDNSTTLALGHQLGATDWHAQESSDSPTCLRGKQFPFWNLEAYAV